MAANCALLCRLLETGVLHTHKQLILAMEGLSLLLTHQVILLAVDAAVHVVEGFSPQRAAARAADEAVSVVKVAHRLARLSRASHLFSASVTDACKEPVGIRRGSTGRRLGGCSPTRNFGFNRQYIIGLQLFFINIGLIVLDPRLVGKGCHRLARLARTSHLLPASVADAKKEAAYSGMQ